MAETGRAAEDPRAMRRRWMGVLARASGADIERFWQSMADKPRYTLIRGPETGLVMIQGRAGGTGRRFSFGEMTVTRCAVALADGTVGHAYVAGRDARHAERAAVFDALLQDGGGRSLLAALIDPIDRAERAHDATRRSKVAATRVEFVTLVRGEDDR